MAQTELMTSLVLLVDALLKQGELSLHEAVAQIAKEHNAKLNTGEESVFPRACEQRSSRSRQTSTT
jgi:hypothetical protein